MKIPKSIRINGIKWVIKHKWNLRDDNGDELDGDCCRETKTICINRAGEDKFSTYLHERFHVLCEENGMRQVLPPGVEELLAVIYEKDVLHLLAKAKK